MAGGGWGLGWGGGVGGGVILVKFPEGEKDVLKTTQLAHRMAILMSKQEGTVVEIWGWPRNGGISCEVSIP